MFANPSLYFFNCLIKSKYFSGDCFKLAPALLRIFTNSINVLAYFSPNNSSIKPITMPLFFKSFKAFLSKLSTIRNGINLADFSNLLMVSNLSIKNFTSFS